MEDSRQDALDHPPDLSHKNSPTAFQHRRRRIFRGTLRRTRTERSKHPQTDKHTTRANTQHALVWRDVRTWSWHAGAAWRRRRTCASEDVYWSSPAHLHHHCQRRRQQKLHLYTNRHTDLHAGSHSVSWSLTSLFSTNMAISETKGQGWKVIHTQWRKASDILISTLAAFLFSSHPKKGKGSRG